MQFKTLFMLMFGYDIFKNLHKMWEQVNNIIADLLRNVKKKFSKTP